MQYLEQLRQVIGLRSYGQKDPLSEFKKEAFTLFEGLLEKIKIDVIKFLLNLNVVISENNEEKKKKENYLEKKTQKVGRNEKCPDLEKIQTLLWINIRFKLNKWIICPLQYSLSLSLFCNYISFFAIIFNCLNVSRKIFPSFNLNFINFWNSSSIGKSTIPLKPSQWVLF